jgi:predicted transcriptional regulator
MDKTKIELPPPEEIADWLRTTRKNHDVTQKELAERAEVSPSQISRVESQKAGTAYEKIYRIQQELSALTDEKSKINVEDILSKKHASRSSEYELAFINPTEPIEIAVDIMEELNISQLPVIEESGKSVGRLTERDLLTAQKLSTRVEEYMRPPMPELTAETPASIARDLLKTNEAVLITPTQDMSSTTENHRYIGILTPSDFTRIENSDLGS